MASSVPGAGELARRIRRRELSSREAVADCIRRCEAAQPALNAVVAPRFEQALAEADAIDARLAAGDEIGPLAGVPITIKECFYLAGEASCIGLSALRDERLVVDGPLVQRLRTAGAVIVAKTNVPQLMIWHECDNPVFGRTNNPWDVSRTPGGSTGGEAALIAAGASPLGLGNDLGGSIRIPCHWCGLHGLKPTAQRLTRRGSRSNFRGMEAIQSQAGPLARQVEDLELACAALLPAAGAGEEPPVPWRDPAAVAIDRLRIAYWTDDGCFPASPAIRRAVESAAAALARAGAQVEERRPVGGRRLVDLYYALLGADGGADARRLARGSVLDWRVRRMLLLGRLPRWMRPAMAALLGAAGQRETAHLVRQTGPRSADGYWRLVAEIRQAEEAFWRQFREPASGEPVCDAFLFPPHALPAPRHGDPIDLIPAASYAFVANVLGAPAGVVSLSRVRPHEEQARPASRDRTLALARSTDEGSAGLPVGVQVMAWPWREDMVLAVMRELERAFAGEADFPAGGWPG